MPTDLRREIKQVKPFQSLEQEAMLNLERTTAVLSHAIAEALKPHGITPTQYNVLRILRGAGADGLCRNEIGCRLVTAMPDVTRLLDRMEEQGLILRERGTDDRRMVRTRLTRKGLDLVGKADAKVIEMHGRQFRHVDKRSLKTLIQVLGEVRDPK